MGESVDEQILRTAKEIVVKFIEVGRVSPTNFNEVFKSIFQTVRASAKGIEWEIDHGEDQV
ncbi:MAG: conjugal transfer protein TraB [Thermodesulfobacteriota bacterium]